MSNPVDLDVLEMRARQIAREMMAVQPPLTDGALGALGQQTCMALKAKWRAAGMAEEEVQVLGRLFATVYVAEIAVIKGLTPPPTRH